MTSKFTCFCLGSNVRKDEVNKILTTLLKQFVRKKKIKMLVEVEHYFFIIVTKENLLTVS